MSYSNIDNVLGYPIPGFVMNQILLRSEMNSVEVRDNVNLVQIANKSGWVRLVSSIDVNSDNVSQVFRKYVEDPTSLAKKFVLFGGTSAYGNISNSNLNDSKSATYSLRSGIQDDGSYGMLGTEEIRAYGFRPFPGIKSVKIQTQGKLGSIRSADIQFSVNDKYQLDIIDTLYFKLGYTMFLEWGNTFFYKENRSNINVLAADPTLYKGEDYSIDPFEKDLDKDKLRYRIAKSIRNSEGNYDAMIGIVTNFNFVSNADGGYDCSLKLMSLGVLGESVRVNNVNKLTDVLEETVRVVVDAANKELKLKYEKQRLEKSNSLDNWPQCIRELSRSGAVLTKANDGTYSVLYNGYRFYYNGRYTKGNETSTKSWECKNDKLYTNGELFKDPKKLTYKEFVDSFELNKQKLQRYTSGWVKNSSKYDFLINRTSGTSYVALENFQKTFTYGDRVEVKLDFSNIGFKADSLFSAKQNETLENINARVMAIYNNDTYLNENYNYVSEADIVIGGFNAFARGFNSSAAGRNKINYYYYSNYRLEGETEFRKFNIYVSYAVSDPKIKRDNSEEIEAALNKLISDPNRTFKLHLFEPFINPIKYTIHGFVKVDNLKTKSSDNLTNLATKSAVVEYQIEFNDSLLFKEVTVKPGQNTQTKFIIQDEQTVETETTTTEATTESSNSFEELSISDIQKREAAKYKSQLEIILRAIQLSTFSELNLNIDGVESIRWITKNKKFIKRLFVNGAFTEYFDRLINVENGQYVKKIDQNEINEYYSLLNTKNRVGVQALFGFHKALMYENFESVTEGRFLDSLIKSDYQVNFNDVFVSYVIPYQQSQSLIEGLDVKYPCYIPMSWFFFILNHCCLLYETQNKNSNVPVFYLDFNPNSNVCQSSPSSLMTDPTKFVVPFQGSPDDYKNIFDPNIVEGNDIRGFKPNDEDEDNRLPSQPLWIIDSVSGNILQTKTGTKKVDAYRAKFLNTLVSIDYLLSIIKNHSSKDETDSVYFKSLVENILSDLNRCTGNNNAFRLSYCDEANCFAVVDDQFTPDGNSLNVVENITSNINNKYKLLGLSTTTEIPVFGKKSVAKSLTINTDIGTKLANMLAISANADSGNRTTAAVDGTTFGKPNIGLIDRYKKSLTAAQGNTNNNDVSTLVKAEIEAAQQFNYAISCFYSGLGTRGELPTSTEDLAAHATSYYIERVAKLRGKDSASNGSMVLPIMINFSTDGISGLSMMQGFTVSDSVLPYSYTSDNLSNRLGSTRKVGFVVTGLDHSIENNTWTTNVKGNMYFIKSSTDYTRGVGIQQRGSSFAITSGSAGGLTTPYSGGYITTFKNSNTTIATQAKQNCDRYLGRDLSDIEWNCLIAASYAEGDSEERDRQSAYIVAVMLNRVRYSKSTVIAELTKTNQFQAVTGTKINGRTPSDLYMKGPRLTIADEIYSGINKYLSSISTKYTRFTSKLTTAYKKGTKISYLTQLKNANGSIEVGNTIFAYNS